MILKYAVVSSNSNPEYLDFWPYVAKAWKNLIGLTPVLIYIDDNPPPQDVYNHGDVIYLKSISEWSIAQQAQCIRFWAAKILDAPFIISDIDMLPISKGYYLDNAKDNIGNTGILSYSSDIIKYRWYRTNPQYPMCYLAGDPQSFIDLLEMNENSHEDFLKRLIRMNLRFGTDQKFFYNQSLKTKFSIKHLERGWIEEKYAVGRLDKVIWPKSDYNVNEYIDCHLPRPFKLNAEMCKELFKKINLF
jgi:hypothetical protein